MKALFIGGTGTISSAIVRRLSQDKTWEVWLINRGNRADTVPQNVHQIVCDINDEEAVLDGEFALISLRLKRKEALAKAERIGAANYKKYCTILPIADNRALLAFSDFCFLLIFMFVY